MEIRRPILVTGSHRSGSTWLGNVLNMTGRVNYINEPLNPESRLNMIFPRNKLWFPAIDYLDKKSYFDSYNLILNNKFKYQYFKSIPKIYYFFKFQALLKKDKNILLKDPIALFSSKFLYEEFNTYNIVLIRKPLSFVGSLKYNNWFFNFDNFIKQNEFISCELPEFRDQISFHKKNNLGIIEDSILLWNIFHSYISKIKAKYKNWYYVKLEDLSIRPILEYENIFNYLNIDYTQNVKNYILKTSSSSNPSERKKNIVHQLNRNSRDSLNNWKKRLSKSEIDLIKRKTQDIYNEFY